MRTKTLLIAAAALAAGILASSAQTYSQNIVGYVNVTAPVGQYNLLCNPLTTGNDVLTNVLQGVPGGSFLQLWNGAGYTPYQWKGSPKHWVNLNDSSIGDNIALPPGIGFFYASATSTNLIFVGTVDATTGGGTATNALSLGYAAVGSMIPYGDVVTNAATFNLTVGGGSTIQIWDPVAVAFTPYQWKGGLHTWQNLNTSVNTNPTVNVGQGFFISPNVATNWIQTLQ